jgi:hypothetical protein
VKSIELNSLKRRKKQMKPRKMEAKKEELEKHK